MLQFLRKYQKFFLAIVTGVIIASFCFFGTYGTIQREAEIPDRPIGALIDDFPLMQQELELLVRFLSTSSDEHQLLEKGQMPNLLNDGVIQRNFLQEGLLSLIAKKYFSEIASEVQDRIDRARTYSHYVHPEAPFLSSQAVWNRFFPEMKEQMRKLYQSSPISEDSLDLLGSLYLNQHQLPPDLLRRILLYEQGQYAWLSKDPRLERIDLSLFGFQSLEEWLGPKFIRIIAQVILNGSATAVKHGYIVSEEEARRSLQLNLRNAITKIFPDKELKGQELYKIYQQQIHALHRDERQVIVVWQKVLNFRNMLENIGSSLIVDASTYREFGDFAREKLCVDAYELPAALHLKSFRDLLKLQTYLEAVAISPGKKPAVSLQLPHLFATAFDVLSRTPELVEHRFTAEVAEVHYETLAQQVTLKQIYEWEMDASNFGLLVKEFPLLDNAPCATMSERYASLEQIEPRLRLQIDKMAKEAIVRAHPEWLETAFAQAEKRTVSFGLRQKGGHLPFMGVTDRDRDVLYISLKNAPIKTRDSSSLPYRFSCDGYHHYEIMLIEPPSTLTLLSFAEASDDGTLDALLDKKLEESYPEIRKKTSAVFQVTSGGWKPLSDVKDQVGAYLYIDLLKAIETAAKDAKLSWPAPDKESRFAQPFEIYAQYRLYPYMRDALSALSQGEGKEGFVAGAALNKHIAEQFRLMKNEKEFTRAHAQALHIEHLFEQPDLTWSSLASTELAKWTFFHVQKKKKHLQQDVEQMVQTGQEHLANEAKREFIEALLKDMVVKKVMTFSLPESYDRS